MTTIPDTPTPTPKGSQDVTLAIDVMLETPAWRTAVRGVEALCRQAAEAAVRAALPSTALADAAVLRTPGLALCVVLEDDGAVAALNKAYRGQDRPTNVLAFAALENADGAVVLPGTDTNDADDEADLDDEPAHLGDVILAFETTRDEAARDDRPLADHLIHLVVHGVLHLLGHDHRDNAQATVMEALETRILATLGIADPYTDSPAETCDGPAPRTPVPPGT